MWKLLSLVLLVLRSCNCQVIDISRCCKDNEDVTITLPNRHVRCQPMSDNFPLPVVLNNGESIYRFPSSWRIRDNTLPTCPAFHELKFIPFTYRNNHFRLFESGSLELYTQTNASAASMANPKHYCLAANGFLACSYNPYMTTNKVLRKCCGENHYLKMPNCTRSEQQHRFMKEDLNIFLSIDPAFFDTNNITVKKGFPYCPNFDRTYNLATNYKILPDANIVLGEHHLIPAGEFCVEHDKTYSKDQVTVVTCSKYAYSYGEGVGTNFYILIFCIFWTCWFRRPY